MVVIFGFGAGKGEDQGEVVACVCPNCHNQVFLHHVRSKKSVRLYFVPVVPYGTDDYLVCPVCSRGLQLSHAQVPHLRSMASTTAAFRAGRYPPDQYAAQAERFWRQLGMHPAGQQHFAGASPGPAPQAPQAPPTGPAPQAPPAPPPAPASPAAAEDETSWVAQLRKLSQLHDQGVLSDEAYAAAKKRLLEQK
jgi:Short C-terminal domain/zinc-ribbon family